MVLDEVLQQAEERLQGGLSKLVLSMPVDKRDDCRRVSVRQLTQGYQAERIIGVQAFQENLELEQVIELVKDSLGSRYRQLNAWGSWGEWTVSVARDGSVRAHTKLNGRTASTGLEHNREKNRLLPEGEVIPPLVDMGIFTSEGRLVPSRSDKYKQINRFLEFIDDVIGETYRDKPFRGIDFGCGKSYLTFVMYHYLTAVKGVQARLTGLDLKAEVIAHCNRSARTYGYDGLDFQVGDIGGYRVDGPLDMVVTLHACNTATDHALFQAVNNGAKAILSVPCCQHELNEQMRPGSFPILSKYGIIKERMAALMTDAIRANMLTLWGYKTQVMEFVDLSHTPKNLLIRAVKSQIPAEVRLRAKEEIQGLMAEFGFQPTLVQLLGMDVPDMEA